MIEAAIALVGALFGAGVAWGVLQAGVKSLRKDLNGLGLKVRDADTRNARRQANVSAALLATCPEEKRVEIAKLLKD